MSEQLNIAKRLKLLNIDQRTVEATAKFKPTLLGALDLEIEKFYQHFLAAWETAEILGGRDLNKLHGHQKVHWLKLFSCQFDQDYVRDALHVGHMHYEYGIAPYIYISGYNFFHCRLIRLATRHHTDPAELTDILVAITRLVSLDMDLALSAYTRDQLRHIKGREERANILWV